MSVFSDTEAGCAQKAKDLLEFLKEADPLEARIVDDGGEWQKIWDSRAEAGNYISRLGTSFGSEITPRVDKLIEAHREARETILNLESLKGPQFFSFGHIGAPSIHASAFYPRKDIPNETKKALVLEWREKSEKLNIKYGGCGGEWGLTGQRVSFLKNKLPQIALRSSGQPEKGLRPQQHPEPGKSGGVGVSQEQSTEEFLLSEINKCKACRFCIDSCGTYLASQGVEPLSAYGRMQTIKYLILGTLDLDDSLIYTLFSCMQCKRCEVTCHSKGQDLPICDVIRKGRTYLLNKMLTGSRDE